MPLKEIRTEFTPATVAHVASSASLSHTVSRGTLAGSSKRWINKEMPDPAVARIEILAQEFFRLIIPHQGETRLLENKATGTHHILSEEVPGYRSLPRGEAANFSNGRYTGLGQALICAMLLQEIDLKNGNIGLDNLGRVAKIDGDWCFAEGRFGKGQRYPLTSAAIERLPYPEGFYAFNWLDLVRQDIAYPRSDIVNPQLANSLQFRAEVNQAILMIALVPDSFVERFVDAYMPAGGARFVDLIKNRREELLTSALKNESFKAYLNSSQAQLDKRNFIAHINSFQANGEGSVVPSDARDITAGQVQDRFDRLLTFKLIEENNLLALANQKLIENILKCKVNENDVLLQNYVDEARQKLIANQDDPTQLRQMKEELTRTFGFVSSAQAVAVKNAAQSLRNSVHWYTRLKIEKADLIESALCNTSLDQRASVITQAGPANQVQEALAFHRHLGKGRKVYKKGDEIDVENAAQTFKNLKAKFQQQHEGTTEENEEEASSMRRPLLK